TDDFKQVLYDARLEMSKILVPNKHFQLIKESLRVQIFILKILSMEHDYIVGKIDIKNMMELIYNFFDRKENISTVESKIIFLNDMLSRLEEIVLNSNYGKWLNNNEEGQL